MYVHIQQWNSTIMWMVCVWISVLNSGLWDWFGRCWYYNFFHTCHGHVLGEKTWKKHCEGSLTIYLGRIDPCVAPSIQAQSFGMWFGNNRAHCLGSSKRENNFMMNADELITWQGPAWKQECWCRFKSQHLASVGFSCALLPGGFERCPGDFRERWEARGRL